MYRQNIFDKPFVVTLKRSGSTVELVRWALSEELLREALAMELSPLIEIVSIKERK